MVKGDGDIVWRQVLADCAAGEPQPLYDGGRIAANGFRRLAGISCRRRVTCGRPCRQFGGVPEALLVLLRLAYRWATATTAVVGQRRSLDRRAAAPGYRFIALADDNFYLVTLTDIELARKQGNLEPPGGPQPVPGQRAGSCRLSNMVVSIEHHVGWITDCLEYLRDRGLATVEAEPDAQRDWVRYVNDVASLTLFPSCNSWYLGANVPGKPRVFMPLLGFPPYVEQCAEVVAAGYRGFTLA